MAENSRKKKCGHGGVTSEAPSGGTPHPSERSAFALWFEAITCEDPEWLNVARAIPRCQEEQILAAWRSWPGRQDCSVLCIP